MRIAKRVSVLVVGVVSSIALVSLAFPSCGGGGGATTCTSDSQCDDGIDCTDDACSRSGQCMHGLALAQCAAGQWCNPKKGCQAGRVCATDDDCVTDNPCVVNAGCDPSSGVCRWSPLDADDDGQVSTACGGTDCDDDDPEVYAGAPERCDGRDNNCDGLIDSGQGATKWCARRFGGSICQADGGTPSCTCPTTSPVACSDGCHSPDSFRYDTANCGGCGNVCPNTPCYDGKCFVLQVDAGS